MSEATECRLQIEGMDCANCAQTITKYLVHEGLKDVSVNYASGTAIFHSDKVISIDKLEKGISHLGYKVITGKQNRKDKNYNSLIVKLIISAVFTFPLLFNMLLPFMWLHNPYVQLALATPVFIIGLMHFGKNAFNALRLGVLHMDLLIIIGAIASYVYSFWGSIILHSPEYLFFETTAAIITLVLTGNLMEQRAVKQTRESLTFLQNQQPEKTIRVNFFGQGKFEINEEIEATNLLIGDYVLIRNGDRIPSDGIIAWGNGTANEAMLTGESTPIEKLIHDKVLAGSILTNGAIKFKVTANNEDTALSKIINLVRDTQMNKPAIQRLADKITSVFVPAVLFIAVVAFFINHFGFDISITQSLLRSIAVLVISCPCAMGLATPAAVMVGIGRAARNGILIKNASILEKIPSINKVVFDKTGTLTTGKFSIKNIEAIHFPVEDLKSLVLSIEKYSSHPVAVSLVNAFKNSSEISLKDIEEIKGSGMRAKDITENIYVIKTLMEENKTGVLVLKNDIPIGKIYLEDELRAAAKSVVEYFNRKKIKTILLSGDKIFKSNAVAASLNITKVYAEQLPHEKLNQLEILSQNNSIMMVGDGINDAPAMAKATVGVSLSSLNNITADTAQVILLNQNIELLPKAFEICRLTYQTIKQNLFWAFFYNTVAIPIAAMGLLSPTLGAAAMAFSDLIVIGNSIWLRYKKIDP